jgi:hypothetical protein
MRKICAGIMVAALLLATQAEANRHRGRSGNASHGDRAYNDALRFAQQHNLGHFTVNKNGTRRIVVNVPSSKISDWCNTFSKGNCYIEPFFNTTPNRYAPGWSMLRVGDKTYKQYGQGSTYRSSTYGGRTAFPVSLTQQELSSTMTKIHDSPNGRWRYNGGDPETTGRNCTNWLTYKIGQFTGVRTGSVKHHMSALTRGYHSPRMSVMAVMSSEPIQNFGQDQLRTNWH